jgi:hypothetical protein
MVISLFQGMRRNHQDPRGGGTTSHPHHTPTWFFFEAFALRIRTIRLWYRFEHDSPLRARLVGTEETTGFSIGAEIETLQAEIGDTGDVPIRFIVAEDEGICLLKEIELID